MSYSKKNHKDDPSDRSTLTGSDISYDGDTESTFSTASAGSSGRLSRRDSFLSSGYSGSSRSIRSPSIRRRPHSSGSSRRSNISSASDRSMKSILKKSRTSSPSPKRGRSHSQKTKKSPMKKNDNRPIIQFTRIKNPAILNQVRGFLTEYSTDKSNFEAFSLNVDGIPFVALSLMNADADLIGRFKKAKPPTPMKKHTPGANNPRKRVHPTLSRSCSPNAKSVRFTDEGCTPKQSKSSDDNEDGIRELGEVVSDAMIETDRQYDGLWKDRAGSAE